MTNFRQDSQVSETPRKLDGGAAIVTGRGSGIGQATVSKRRNGRARARHESHRSRQSSPRRRPFRERSCTALSYELASGSAPATSWSTRRLTGSSCITCTRGGSSQPSPQSCSQRTHPLRGPKASRTEARSMRVLRRPWSTPSSRTQSSSNGRSHPGS